tara:strand:- start:3756 stop:4661 length:906 start_codon:yes stop_codon:yes gene_type:complete
MANRILLGDIGSTFGLKVSRAGTDVTTGADKDMLFDSTKNRTGQIYGGGAGINFVDSSSDQRAYVRGTANLFSAALFNQGNLTGKKIIIDGTTVTLSSTTSYLQYTWTSVDDIKDDINAASISGITALKSTLSSSDHRLALRKTTSDMVISYPASNSLETIIGIAGGTYDYPDLASNGVNFLTASGTSKPNLGYVPLVVLAEQVGGGYEGEVVGDDIYEAVNRLSLWKTTSSTIHPVMADADEPSSATTNGTFVGDPVIVGREYGYNEGVEGEVETAMVNANFFVLRVPCAYGYMTSTYFG